MTDVLTPLRVLIVEDNPDDAELLVHELQRADLDPNWKLVATETVTPFPLISIAVEPRDRDVIENAVVGSVLPKRSFHSGKLDLVNGLAIGCFGLGLLGWGWGFVVTHRVSPFE